MSLSATVNAGVAAAFRAVGDMAVEVEYDQVVGGAYDSSTGETTRAATTLTMLGVSREVKLSEVNGNVLVTDTVLIVNGVNLGSAPAIDETVRVDGVGYTLIKVGVVAKGGLYRLFVRRMGG